MQVLVAVAARVADFKPPGKEDLSRALKEVAEFRAPGQYVLLPWLAPQAAELAAAAAGEAKALSKTLAMADPTPAGGSEQPSAAVAGPGAPRREGGGEPGGNLHPGRANGNPGRGASGSLHGTAGEPGFPLPGATMSALGAGESGGAGAGAAQVYGAAAGPAAGYAGRLGSSPALPAAEVMAAEAQGAAAAAGKKKEKKRKRLVRLGEDGAPSARIGDGLAPAAKDARRPAEQAPDDGGRLGRQPDPAEPHVNPTTATNPNGTLGAVPHPGAAAGPTRTEGPGRRPEEGFEGGFGKAAAGEPAGEPAGPHTGAPPGLRSSRSASSSEYDASWFAAYEGRAPAAYAPVGSGAQAAAYVREYHAKHGVYFRLHQEIEANRRCGLCLAGKPRA